MEELQTSGSARRCGIDGGWSGRHKMMEKVSAAVAMQKGTQVCRGAPGAGAACWGDFLRWLGRALA